VLETRQTARREVPTLAEQPTQIAGPFRESGEEYLVADPVDADRREYGETPAPQHAGPHNPAPQPATAASVDLSSTVAPLVAQPPARRPRRSPTFTSSPEVPAPQLLCPSCDRFLVYRETVISGVKPIERWDYFECRTCGTFVYRDRTRKLRPAS
jgi:hypothetical protein